MKKSNLISVVWFATLVAFSAQNVMAAEEIVIVGTGSGSSILKAIGDEFSKIHPEITITIPKSIGSGGGIKAVGNDENIVGRVARGIEEHEKSYELTAIPFAKMPIVFLVNNSVALTDITTVQACKIFDGTTREWKEIKGGTGKIRVIRREDGDSSLLVLLETLLGFKDITLTPRSKTTFSDPETIAMAGKVENSIAFGTWPNVKSAKGVHALSLNGVKPTNAKYPCVGTLSLVFKEKNNNGNLKLFLDFLSSKAAKTAIINAGGLPAK